MPTAMSINTHALIVELADGSIRVFYEGVKYAKNQFVPGHIFGIDTDPGNYITAAGLVKAYMLAKFGDDQEKWPKLVCDFLDGK